MDDDMNDVRHLTRLRWGVRAVLTLGVAASVCANVLHAQPHPISQTIAAWPPIALLLTVELISRVPVYRRALAVVRLLATTAIAGIAAWVSYWHMAGVAARFGETGASAYLLPLSVDGLIVVGSVCLVELGGRLAATTASAEPAAPAVAIAGPDDRALAVVPSGRAIQLHPAAQPHDAVPAPAVAAPAKSVAPPPLNGDELRAAPDVPVPVYQPVGEDDAAMYDVWRRGVAAGRDPSGANLARAAGRSSDATGIGRRAARRYRDAHAQAAIPTGVNAPGPTEDATAAAAARVAALAAAPDLRPDNGAPKRHNGHTPTLTGAAL
jgi:uncharacterized protein DUF2637